MKLIERRINKLSSRESQDSEASPGGSVEATSNSVDVKTRAVDSTRRRNLVAVDCKSIRRNHRVAFQTSNGIATRDRDPKICIYITATILSLLAFSRFCLDFDKLRDMTKHYPLT
ncbi:hypothetical protein KPH14_009640 [Odynerus spinipes]|uniref:Uncharacterized protein n=1 Tax=Odynerus spinipes TaxID=1348599 RepID=A0AAD9RQ15_9HYME|nr:hypothetical protein KPH14_009640 [Odynerus spinipes]